MSELSKKARNRTRVQMVLTMLVIVSIIRQFFLGNYHNMFLGILTLILFMVPQFIDKKLGVTIPVGLETVILIFIFSAEILGEINAFYVKIPVWDTILHTTNGFLMAAIGFALIDLFNRSDRFSIKMSPYFVAFFAFCFSMTVGVLWEFFEFSMDWFFGMDMQKDWIVPAINSVKLNPTGANIPIHVDVQSVVINGETWNLGGYLRHWNRRYNERSYGEFCRSCCIFCDWNFIFETSWKRKTGSFLNSTGERYGCRSI